MQEAEEELVEDARNILGHGAESSRKVEESNHQSMIMSKLRQAINNKAVEHRDDEEDLFGKREKSENSPLPKSP
jgi:hypothetical protein